MKKIFAFSLILISATSFVLAAEQKGTNSLTPNGQGQQLQDQQQIETNNQEQTQTQNQGEESQITNQVQNRLKVQSTEELKESIQQKSQEMAQEMNNLQSKEAGVYQNQNKVRMAVHSLLAMEDLAGDIGQQVSKIAQEFNNSVQATIRAEEKIQNRNQIAKFLAGGDYESAEAIEQEVNQNRERIKQLKQLQEQCECAEEVKNTFQEQIQNMEQEQNRLQQFSERERQYRGLFGWFFRLFQ